MLKGKSIALVLCWDIFFYLYFKAVWGIFNFFFIRIVYIDFSLKIMVTSFQFVLKKGRGLNLGS